MIINSEKIIKALNRYFGQERQEYFEKVVGEPITSFVKTYFNAVCFDIEKFENLFKYDIQYSNISINDWIKEKYGQEFYTFFAEELTSRSFNALAIMEK